ncbi:50S ribosomal protein L18 [Candidatus Pacearchaeota archaeon]|nr:50S ribosomal protein L18 [Candidatus Pacearchaeota archaeon]
MKIAKRRRRENKTDYKKRIKMLKGGIPRVIFRKSNRYVITQYVSSKQAQDKIEFGASSKDLLKYGWPKENQGSLKSIPASYLTGFLIGKKITKEAGTPILDFGMQRVLHKTKTFAFLKGLVDAGVKVQHDEKFFPDENRIKGKHMKKDFSSSFEQIKSNIEKNG